MFRSMIATVPGKLAVAAVGMTFATTGLAAANAFPGPVQQAAASLGGAVGLDVPAPDDNSTPPTDETTAPPTDGTTATTGGTTTTTGGTTTTTMGGTTPTTGGPTAPTGAGALAPPATTAEQAAHIHDFDQACGNHGRYVSYVARNNAEPPCAAAVRGGQAPTGTGNLPSGTNPGKATEPTNPTEPADAGKPAKPAKGPDTVADTSNGKAGGKAKG